MVSLTLEERIARIILDYQPYDAGGVGHFQAAERILEVVEEERRAAYPGAGQWF